MINKENIDEIKKYEDYERAKKHVKEIKGFYTHLIVYLVVNVLILINDFRFADWDNINFWMFSTAFFWGIGLLFHAYGVFGKHLIFNKEWEERKIREFMEKDKMDLWN